MPKVQKNDTISPVIYPLVLYKIIWSVYAYTYDAGVSDLKIYSELMHDVSKVIELKQRETLIDFGCGTGNLERELIGNGAEFAQIIGFDISPGMLDTARKKITDTRITFQQHDLNHKIPLPNDFADKVVLIHSLYALKNPQRVLQEVHRILKPHGKLIIANPYDKVNGMAKIKAAAFRDKTRFAKLWAYVSKLPIIMINGIIAKAAHKGKYHFLDANQMNKLLTSSGFIPPKKYNFAYADTDLLFVSTKK